MYYHQLKLAWISIFMLIVLPFWLSAQCVAPGSPWLNAPQTSSSLTLNWPVANGATQYQMRYWETTAPGDKTVLEEFVTAPFTLDGLRKNTTYTIQLRSICGAASSPWGAAVNLLTAKSSQNCSVPAGVAVTANIGMLQVSWTSMGSHSVRYRPGYTGDWIVISGASDVTAPNFIISGLPGGTYQVEVKHNCSETSSYYTRLTRVVPAGCPTPVAPVVVPDVTSASVTLPFVGSVTTYNLQYRLGTMNPWVTVGTDIPPSVAYLNPPLAHSTLYQVRIQATCAIGDSDFSPPATFTTLAIGVSCLPNKNFGIDLSLPDKVRIDADFNHPSPFTMGSMIGINDGGLIFRSFQNEVYNQILDLTPLLRIFHTMDEDFDDNLTNYDDNTKPKDTSPEGTPAHTDRNKGFYSLYHNTHEFAEITGAVELLQYSPQSWKDKMYKESDWSASGPSGIKSSFEHYTQKIIDEFAPPNGSENQLLMANFQVGNELWDYPVPSDYHNLLTGARSAFVSKYGAKSAGGWKMKLVAGAFQAYRDNTCTEILRDTSNCGGSLERHDFIGHYLDVPDCNVLKDLDAIDCHPYSFLSGTVTWTFPENPLSEDWQSRNMAGWLAANQSAATGILQNTRLWATEYGFDSNPNTGVGEKTQSAYLIRGLFLLSRYHFEKVFFYNAFDHSRMGDPYYEGLYNSTGFWRLGTHPANNAWPSPLIAHGATPKPSWFGMLDLKARFGDHVFYKALLEDAEASVYLLAKPDGSDPYLVFWSPSETNDANINEEIAVHKTINWEGILPGNYSLSTPMAQLFAESAAAGENFFAATGMTPGIGVLTAIRRNPAFIPLQTQTGICPRILSFQRHSHTTQGCDPNDRYYEMVLSNVTLSEQIIIEGLPLNGINIGMSSLNGVAFTAGTFQSNVLYVSNNSLRWEVNPSNGSTQMLKLFYCWAKNYPEPVGATSARADCSGSVTLCSEAGSRPELVADNRGNDLDVASSTAFGFSVQPNPGRDQIWITYAGEPTEKARLRIVSPTGQLMSTTQFKDLIDQQQWTIDATGLPPGIYFIGLQTDKEMRYRTWEKY